MARKNNRGSAMTVADAGRKGGLATSSKYGSDHYRKIGGMGGRMRAKKAKQNRTESQNSQDNQGQPRE